MRKIKKTCLVVCEGKADKNFLDFIRMNYQNEDWKITVDTAKGDPNSVILRAIKTAEGYDRVYCVTDDDTIISKPPPKKFKVFKFSPCLEGFLLELVYNKKVKSEFKTQFKNYFSCDVAQISKEDWEKKFHKEKLESWRKVNFQFDQLVKIFESP